MNSYLFFSCCCFFLFVITECKTKTEHSYSHTLFLPPIHPKSICGAWALRRRNRSLPSCSKHVSKRHIAHYDENQLDPPCFPVIGGSQQSCTWGRILDVHLLVKLSLTHSHRAENYCKSIEISLISQLVSSLYWSNCLDLLHHSLR